MLNLQKTLLVVSCLFISWNSIQSEIKRNDEIDLSGRWQFKLDSLNIGIQSKWYQADFNETVFLPGTTDTNKKGIKNTKVELNHLTRKFKYEGKVWFSRKVNIPQSWKGKKIVLSLERSKATDVWIDGGYVGGSKSLSVPQKFILSDKFSVGEHVITISVDNSLKLFPVGGSHAVSEHTQTNWNGIVGKILLKSSSEINVAIKRLLPDVDKKTVKVELEIQNPDSKFINAEINISAYGFNTKAGEKSIIKSVSYPVSTNDKAIVLTYDYPMGDSFLKWDEYTPNLYKLRVEMFEKGKRNFPSNTDEVFGMRKLEIKDNKFWLNDNLIFLRSKHDACVFPLTGYPSMTKKEWIRQMKISKSYGINSYRFHSWTPSKACFEAADIVGIYLQPELPNWRGFNDNDTIDEHYRFQLDEGKSIFMEYASHPSFMFFSLGNELGGSKLLLTKMLQDLRPYAGSKMLAQGSNNHFWDPKTLVDEDFFITAKTGKYSPNFDTEIRASFAFVDDPMGGGVLNRQYPNTEFTFKNSLVGFQKPVVAHETGQYQLLPNFDEIKKYKGVLLPLNFVSFQQKMIENKLYSNWRELYKASGALSALCYKADNEMLMRTKELAGFQMLDLQDFPGQGTALVGMLDAFMDSKGMITAKDWRQSCNDLTIQANMKKHVWTNDESFHAKIILINYSTKDIVNNSLQWKIMNKKGKVFATGVFDTSVFKKGEISNVGEITFSLSDLLSPEQLTLYVHNTANNINNEYRFWVYPKRSKQIVNPLITYNTITKDLINRIEAGDKIVFVPDINNIELNSVGGLFTSDYWNYPMFRNISLRTKKPVSPGTMGLLIDNSHPVFKSFPTGKYTDWQWWSVVKNSRPMFLDQTNERYKPIIQVVDNFERASKLGILYEFKLGKGAILICSVDLSKNDIVINALENAISQYVHSEKFNPKETVTKEELARIIFNKQKGDIIRQTNDDSNIEGYFK